MKRFIITLAAVAMTCGAMFAQNRGDMYVGGILGVAGGSSKTSVTVGSTTMKGDSTPSDLTLAMIHPTCLHLCTKLLSKARKGDAIHPEKSALFTIY